MDDRPLELRIKSFNDELINLINSSGLPISIAYIILKDVFNRIEKLNESNTNDIINEYYNKKKENNSEI